jgi:PAS domain S-box-containing protein
MRLRSDEADRRRTIVEFCKPFQEVLDHYVDGCFEEFEELITSHHDRERHKAERELRDSQMRWESLVRESPDRVILLDTDLNIQFINRTISGRPVEEVIGTSLGGYHTEDQRRRIKSIVENVIASRQPSSYEAVYDRPGGETVIFESRIVPRVIDDAVIGLTVHSRDITERKRAEEALGGERETLSFPGRSVTRRHDHNFGRYHRLYQRRGCQGVRCRESAAADRQVHIRLHCRLPSRDGTTRYSDHDIEHCLIVKYHSDRSPPAWREQPEGA